MSLTDIARALAANGRAAATGAVPDEGLVNRLRSLDGRRGELMRGGR